MVLAAGTRTTELVTEVVHRFGTARIRVQGTSMLPALRPADEVELRSTRLNQIKIGDIVAFQREGRLFVHRVIENSAAGLITRGDALPQVDPAVSESELLGVISAVFRNGKKADQRDSWLGRSAAALFQRSQFSAALFVKFGLFTSAKAAIE